MHSLKYCKFLILVEYYIALFVLFREIRLYIFSRMVGRTHFTIFFVLNFSIFNPIYLSEAGWEGRIMIFNTLLVAGLYDVTAALKSRIIVIISLSESSQEKKNIMETCI